MVSSGATAPEDLPSQTSYGDLDPSTVQTLARHLDGGAERINEILTRHSGLTGLAGRDMTIEQPLETQNDSLAADVLHYRMLLAVRMAVATPGGLDVVVASGLCARSGVDL